MANMAITVKLDKEDSRLLELIRKIERHPSFSETFRVALRFYAKAKSAQETNQ